MKIVTNFKGHDGRNSIRIDAEDDEGAFVLKLLRNAVYRAREGEIALEAFPISGGAGNKGTLVLTLPDDYDPYDERPKCEDHPTKTP